MIYELYYLVDWLNDLYKNVLLRMIDWLISECFVHGMIDWWIYKCLIPDDWMIDLWMFCPGWYADVWTKLGWDWFNKEEGSWDTSSRVWKWVEQERGTALYQVGRGQYNSI